MAVFPDLLKWSPTLRRALWRCRNVGFPRPECRVTAPISAVWWPEEEASEILAWRKKKEGRRRWERQEGIFVLSWDLRWNGRTLKRDSDTHIWVNTALYLRLCAGVSPPSAGQKLGSGSAAPRKLKELNLSAWVEKGETRFSCFQSMWNKQRIPSTESG